MQPPTRTLQPPTRLTFAGRTHVLHVLRTHLSMNHAVPRRRSTVLTGGVVVGWATVIQTEGVRRTVYQIEFRL